MRILTLLFAITICLVSFKATYAQNEKIIESDYFTEVIGWSKLKFLSNGNTAKVDVTDKEGIKISLYDTTGKTVASNELQLTFLTEKLKEVYGKGIYEINKELVLFFLDFPKKVPTLYRIRIDINTAALIKEDVVAEHSKIGTGAAFAIGFGGTGTPGFLVEKDPESDYYGVIIYDPLAKESNERVEVIHFNPDHSELNRAFFTSPDNSFKYLDYTSMFVKSSEYILLSTFVYNTKSSGGESSFLYFSKLEKGKKDFVNTQLSYTENYFDNVSCVYEYDKVNKVIYYMIMTMIEKKIGEYEVVIQPYSVLESKLLPSYSLPFKKLADYYFANDPKRKEYLTMPHNFSIDQNGNLTVLLQRSDIQTSSNSTYTSFSDIGLTNFSLNGNENYGFLIPYANRVYGGYRSHYYYRTQRGLKPSVGYMPMGMPKPFLHHIDMITTKENNYLLFNTPLKNFENEKLGTTSSFGMAISSSHAVMYKIDKSGKVVKDFLLEKSTVPAENKFCFFYTSAFDENTGKYAVIKIERINNVKQSSVIWLTLE